MRTKLWAIVNPKAWLVCLALLASLLFTPPGVPREAYAKSNSHSYNHREKTRARKQKKKQKQRRKRRRSIAKRLRKSSGHSNWKRDRNGKRYRLFYRTRRNSNGKLYRQYYRVYR